jgi:hypothetical protein
VLDHPEQVRRHDLAAGRERSWLLAPCQRVQVATLAGIQLQRERDTIENLT